jgi:hypothetical protein
VFVEKYFRVVCLPVHFYLTNMSKKRKTESDTSENKSKSHRVNTTETKLEIIRRAVSAESLASIGRSLDLSLSTVFSILKEKDKLK